MIKTLKNIFLVFLCLLSIIACGTSKEEKVKNQMETYLREKYGEEFVVDMIGLRSANEEKFYQARIYPKSIIGTPREDDDYYYGSASIDVDSFGKLDKDTGDDYSFIKFNDDTENYLLPKAKELFGDKIRIKVDASLKIRDTEEIIKKAYEKIGVINYQSQNIFLEYKESHFKNAKQRIIDNPRDNRLELNIYIYVFNKIDDEKEKEERREQLFEFLQYLRSEGLDRYLAIDCNFMDDIVLAPSFQDKKYILELSDDKEEKASIEKKLREEVEKIDEKEILKNIEKIRKSDFEYDRGKMSFDYMISGFQIVTYDYLKYVDFYGRYEEAINDKTIERHYYKTKNDIDYGGWNDHILGRGEK